MCVGQRMSLALKQMMGAWMVTMLWAVSASAQTMYRCGNTFQQAPCDAEGAGAITVKEAFRSSMPDAGSHARAGGQKAEEARAPAKPRAGKGAKNTARKKAAASCPTALEIRNAKVGANSITLSDQERAKRLKAIEKMERCGKRE